MMREIKQIFNHKSDQYNYKEEIKMYKSLKELIDNNQGMETKFFIPMRPLNSAFGIVCFTTSSDPELLIECHIGDRYDIEEGYKVEIISDVSGFGSDTFYQCDFLSFIEEGRFYVKEDGEYVEVFSYEEPIGDSGFVARSWATTIVKK